MLIPALRLLEPHFYFIISLLTVSWHCTVLKAWLQHGLPSDHPFLHAGWIWMTPQTRAVAINTPCQDYFKLQLLQKQRERKEKAILQEKSCTTDTSCSWPLLPLHPLSLGSNLLQTHLRFIQHSWQRIPASVKQFVHARSTAWHAPGLL